MKTIRVGSRDSKLAIIQTQIVIDAIYKYDSNINIELITMKTTGDKILDKTLDKIGGKGLFVKELDEALLNGDVDITVHSYKDMPMEINNDLPVVAVSKREDERDVLILSKNNFNNDAPLGCSSKRRILQLTKLGYDNIIPLRGNVITRLAKLDKGEYSGIVLASAGIKRLGLEERVSKYFEVNEIIPSACQGIIAVQARKGENTDFLKCFHNLESFYISEAERAFVRTLNGGCSSPIAAYAYLDKEVLILTGLYADENMNNTIIGSNSGSYLNAVSIGENLANSLKERGGMK